MNVSLNSHSLFLGVDVGATSVKSALVNNQGEIVSQVQKSPVGKNTDNEMLAQVLEHALQKALEEILLLRTSSESPFILEGIGVGSPGPLDDKKGIIFYSANFPLVKNFFLLKVFEDFFKNQTEKKSQNKFQDVISSNILENLFLQNDANCAALGQFYFVQKQQAENMLVYTLGTGVGGGFIYQKKLFSGYKGNSFEIGHTSVPNLANLYNNEDLRFPPLTCGCGANDCLETFSSATGIRRRYEQLTQKYLPVEEIAELARKKEEKALRVFQAAGYMLGHSVVDAVHLINAERVVFTGGLTPAEDLILPYIQKAIDERMFKVFKERLSIEFSAAQKQSGIRGAAALCLQGK